MCRPKHTDELSGKFSVSGINHWSNCKSPNKKHDDDNNGYGAWNALCECYDWYAAKKETAYSLITKLEIYRIKSVSNTAQDINNF